MPRDPKRGRPQIAKRRREKRHEAADWSHRRTRARFPFSLFSNVKLFAVLGVLIMGGSLLAGGAFTLRSTSSNPDFVTPEDQEQALSTVQPAAEGTVAPDLTAGRYSAPPALEIDTSKSYVAVIRTSKGDVQLELYAKEAPQTVNNFVFLARDGFYDGLSFHRVISGFVAQAGDPVGDGTGGPGYFLEDEQSDLTHDAEVIAMARTADGRVSGSQFYITYAAQPQLDDRGFTVFGKVISGMDVVEALTVREPGQPDAPPGDEILSIEIDES